ncbi:unnamed protein product [Cyprideis torosa]|uniref:Uncharacterized protein n=1 Tax=Cyprideis torosa TaxID=163714 RepID=A0A7R8WBQ4_9CRUS|nr:unnamed protein product [Cyprideis torosa]CAG0889855.1 unnamed protein product [Cyprideis torosa]
MAELRGRREKFPQMSYPRDCVLLCTTVFVSLTLHVSVSAVGLLYPFETETRETKVLDGVWDFKVAPPLDPDLGFREEWYQRPLRLVTSDVIPMPVPSSYNDVTASKSLQQHVGWWVNGAFLMNHTGGHLPFEAEATEFLVPGSRNWVTVAINNTLTQHSIPMGQLKYYSEESGFPAGYRELQFNFDFFNYAGIHRHVHLYTVPSAAHVNDVTVVADTTQVPVENKAYLDFSVSVVHDESLAPDVEVHLYDETGNSVATATGTSGRLSIVNPVLWWPYLMNETYGYLYELEVVVRTPSVQSNDPAAFAVWTEAKSLHSFQKTKRAGDVLDVYRLKVGLRSLTWDNDTMAINGKPIYFRGFGMHEDHDFVSAVKGRKTLEKFN